MTGERVFGMGETPTAEATWPALTEDEIAEAVAGAWPGLAAAEITWRSARPLSSTVGVRTADGIDLVVKRVPARLRDPAALAEEHRFMDHVRGNGIPVPEARTATQPSLGAAFVYEVQRAGEGQDRYRADFSWSPYAAGDAAGAGRMLARLHVAAAGFDAPARPARPLLASMHGGVVRAVEWHIARRPAVAEFLTYRDWRAEVRDLEVDLSAVEPLWTHGDWHGTNLLWRGHEVSTVFDFGLADRTTAMFDLATAIERAAVDWVSLRNGGAPDVREDQIRALIEGYRSVRPLPPAERRLLPDLLPLVHLGYELSEIDYFLTVARQPRNAEIAYRDWLLGHLDWFRTAAGQHMRGFVRDVAAG
ncbi:phosphotransferase enzyme family protein [Nocardia rhizosphaerae]|uniref:Phosphotransferase enzyme family protein n=1 Tax=Nocardia rhizosphaerae TaxID=1691571 RepID=A0ABV8LA77_9NOCA